MNDLLDRAPTAVGAAYYDSPEALLEGERARALALALKYGVPAQDFEDLLQELFIQLFVRWEELEHPSRWFFVSLRYSCLLYHRRHREPQAAMLATALERLHDPSTPSEDLVHLRLAFDALLPRLAPLCRGVLHARFREGLRAGEIAERLGLEVAVVYRALAKCLEAFRRAVLTP